MPKTRRGKPEPEPEQPAEKTKREPLDKFAAVTEMLGYVIADAYPKAIVPDKLQEIADALEISNPFGADAQINYPTQVPCPHGSYDGQACCAMNCHVADVPGKLEALIRKRKTEIEAEIEFRVKVKGATMNPKGELTFTVAANTSDPWELHRRLVSTRDRDGNLYLALDVVQAESTVPMGQQSIPFDEPPKPEPENMIVCATCKRIARGEAEEPGRICGFCVEGELQMVSVIPLYCSECKQPQELATTQAGDNCTLCKEGRYLMGKAPVVETSGDLIRFIPPSRVAELTDAVCGLSLHDCRAKAIVTIGTERFVISEIASSDPIIFEAWRAVLIDEYVGVYREKPEGANLDRLRVRLHDADGIPGAVFVLVGPAIRVIAQAEDADEPLEGEAD